MTEGRSGGIGVITNPRSRENRRDPSTSRRFGYLLGSRGSAEETGSIEDLYRVAERFRREKIDVLGINGGDGTIHHTLSVFIEVYAGAPLPMVALLRGGTMNTVAQSLGIRGEPARLLLDLVDRYHRDALEPFDQPILAIGSRHGFIFGAGIIYNFLSAYYATGAPSGMTAVALLGRAIGSALVNGRFAAAMTRRLRARVVADGVPWEREEFMAIAAATVREIGLGFKPFPRCGERRDRFSLLGIHAARPLGFAVELPQILRGRPMRSGKVIDALVGEAVIEGEGGLDYMIDGDLYRSETPLRIGLGPTLRVVGLGRESPR